MFGPSPSLAEAVRSVRYAVVPEKCHQDVLDRFVGPATYCVTGSITVHGETVLVSRRTRTRYSAFRRLFERMSTELSDETERGPQKIPELPTPRSLALIHDERFCAARAAELTTWLNNVASGERATTWALSSAALYEFVGGARLMLAVKACVDKAILAAALRKAARQRREARLSTEAVFRARSAPAAPSDGLQKQLLSSHPDADGHEDLKHLRNACLSTRASETDDDVTTMIGEGVLCIGRVDAAQTTRALIPSSSAPLRHCNRNL